MSGSVTDVQKALDDGANPNRIINGVVNACGQLSTLRLLSYLFSTQCHIHN